MRRKRRSTAECNQLKEAIVGKKVGYVTVLSFQGATAFCKCDCGKLFSCRADNLYDQTRKICSPGCAMWTSRLQLNKRLNYKKGDIKVVKCLGKKGNRTHFLCKCKCGNKIEVPSSRLYNISSCGKCNYIGKLNRKREEQLTEKQVLEIDELLKSYSIKDVAEMMNVKFQMIWRISRRISYKRFLAARPNIEKKTQNKLSLEVVKAVYLDKSCKGVCQKAKKYNVSVSSVSNILLKKAHKEFTDSLDANSSDILPLQHHQ